MISCHDVQFRWFIIKYYTFLCTIVYNCIHFKSTSKSKCELFWNFKRKSTFWHSQIDSKTTGIHVYLIELLSNLLWITKLASVFSNLRGTRILEHCEFLWSCLFHLSIFCQTFLLVDALYHVCIYHVSEMVRNEVTASRSIFPARYANQIYSLDFWKIRAIPLYVPAFALCDLNANLKTNPHLYVLSPTKSLKTYVL